MPKENISVSTCETLGKAGENHEFFYGTVTFTDSGCFEIYGNVTIIIDTLINNKIDTESYDFKVFGNAGAAGEDGEQTILLIIVEKLKSSIKLYSTGGNGGKGIDGGKGGKGGLAPSVTITYAEKAENAAITIDSHKGRAGRSSRKDKNKA